MVMGVSSYSRHTGRRRPVPGRPPPNRPLGKLTEPLEPLFVFLGRVWNFGKPALSLVALAHLVLLALFPGGGNDLFGVRPGDGPKYLTPVRVADALGYDTLHDRDGFLVFKLFPQEGGMVHGTFPDERMLPRLRYERWVAAGHVASGPYPELHRLILDKVLQELPSPPVRLELYAARYRWDRDSLTFPWPGKGPVVALELRRLGVYQGFSRAWEPAVVLVPEESR